MSAFTSWMTDCVWPAVAVRTMPGRSTTVRSGASGLDMRMTMLSVEKPLSERVSVFVSRWITSESSSGLETLICCAELVVAACAVHASPARAFFITRRTGHRVVSPEPRGKGTPLSASSTELLPDDWSPITAICGTESSLSSESARRSSASSSHGRTSLSYPDCRSLSSAAPSSSAISWIASVRSKFRLRTQILLVRQFGVAIRDDIMEKASALLASVTDQLGTAVVDAKDGTVLKARASSPSR